MANKLDPTRCIEQVSSQNGWHFCQCSRKRGHGKTGEYCRQHDPERIAAKRKAKSDAYDAEHEHKQAQHERNNILNSLAEGITTHELKKFKLMYKPELGTLLDTSTFIMRTFGKLLFDNWPVSVPGKDKALGKIVDHQIRIQEVLEELK